MDVSQIENVEIYQTMRDCNSLGLYVIFAFDYKGEGYTIQSVHTDFTSHGRVACFNYRTSRKKPFSLERDKYKIYNYLIRDPNFGFEDAYVDFKILQRDELNMVNHLGEINNIQANVYEYQANHEVKFTFNYHNRTYTIIGTWDQNGYVGCNSLICDERGQNGLMAMTPLNENACEVLIDHLKQQTSTRLQLVTHGLT